MFFSAEFQQQQKHGLIWLIYFKRTTILKWRCISNSARTPTQRENYCIWLIEQLFMFSYVLNWSKISPQNFYQLQLFLEWCLSRLLENDLKEGEKTNKNYLKACKHRSCWISVVRAALFRFRLAALLCRGQVLRWFRGVPFLERGTVWRVYLDTRPLKVRLVVDAPGQLTSISSILL